MERARKQMRLQAELYRFHVENLRSIQRTLDRISLAMRDAVSRDNSGSISTFTRLYALLLGAWAECRLAKLLHEPNGFDEHERSQIQQERTHLGRWLRLVEIAFRKHYNVPQAALSMHTLPHSAHSRYRTLDDLLRVELRSIITLRNKLAHGQWVYPLNDDGTDIAQKQFDALRLENCLTLQLKRNLLEYVLQAVQDLALSKPAFERDFDEHYRAIEQTKQTLANRSYKKYAENMQGKYQRGQRQRAANLSSARGG